MTTADVLATAGVVAVLGVVALVTLETFRPSAPRYGRQSEWDEVPGDQFPVSHNGTNTTRRRNDHVR